MKIFLAFFEGDEEPFVSLKDGAASLRIALAAKIRCIRYCWYCFDRYWYRVDHR